MPDLWKGQPDGDVQRVKDASDIVRLIGEVVALRPKGREYAGLCPFHDDHDPSMMVVPSKQIYKCFSCGAGGDVLGFVQRFHRMDFREALEFLAQRAGLELTKRRPDPAAEQPGYIGRAELVEANATAGEFFKAILKHEEHGAAARGVIASRGISEAMVETFGLGAAPDRYDGLLLTLKSKRLMPRAFVEAGLLREKESGGGEARVYDTFRHRLMFPIQDIAGRVIAFGGRKLRDEDEPKYLNSPESRVFNKSGTLYGLPQASRSIQRAKRAVITEGYMDTIACHQAGVTNVVATLGTALTREHAVILRRVCEEVILLFDGDAAGQRAADRAVEVFFSEPLDVRIATLSRVTDAKDPDELLKRPGGRELLDQAIEQATDLLRYRFSRVEAAMAGSGVNARGRAMQEEIARLVDLGLADLDPIRRRLIIKELARVAGIDETTITAAIPSGRAARRRVSGAPPGAAGAESGGGAGSGAGGGASGGASAQIEAKPRDAARDEDAAIERIRLARGTLTTAEHLLGCVLCEPSLLSALTGESHGLMDPGVYASGLSGRVAAAVHTAWADEGSAELNLVLTSLAQDEDAQAAATLLAERIETATEGNKDRLRAHWQECVRESLRARRAASAPAPSDAGPMSVQDAMARLKLRQEQERTLGANRRALPRPPGD